MLHLIMANGINFRQVTSVVGRTVLGEKLSYPIAVPNPWMVLPHLSHVLLVMFFLDASVRCWRRGERRQALTFGTGTILFGTIILFFALSVLWGLVPIPIIGSFAVLFIVAPVLYELNYDMHHAAMLTEKLEERDARLTETLEQLQLSASAGNVGLWTRKIGEETFGSMKKPERFGALRAENNLRGKISFSRFMRMTVHCSLLSFGNWKKEKTNFSWNIELCRRLLMFDGFIRAAKWRR
jgi:hypothetical protein